MTEVSLTEVSHKPANDQHALAGLGETLVGLETEKNKKNYREATQTGCVYNRV